jgi:hypothetical protein
MLDDIMKSITFGSGYENVRKSYVFKPQVGVADLRFSLNIIRTSQ